MEGKQRKVRDWSFSRIQHWQWTDVISSAYQINCRHLEGDAAMKQTAITVLTLNLVCCLCRWSYTNTHTNRWWHLVNTAVSYTHTRTHTHKHKKIYWALPWATSRWKGSINHITCRLIGYDEFSRRSHVTVFTSDFSPVSTENENDSSGEGKWEGTQCNSSPAPGFQLNSERWGISAH